MLHLHALRLHAMGVPAFYRWLHDSYKRCVRDYIIDGPAAAVFPGESASSTATLENQPDDWPPNPNGIEVDNFYIDFNSQLKSSQQ